MHGKTFVYVFIAALIAIFAYHYTTLPQTSSSVTNEISKEAQQALEGTAEIRAVTGTLAEMNNENIMVNTDEGILTIKKSEATKYTALDNGISTQIEESQLLVNDQLTLVVGVNSENEITALSVSVVR